MKRIAVKFIYFLFSKSKYKVPYIISYCVFVLKYKFLNHKNEFDLVFVIPEHTRGWILEAICREIAKYYNGRIFYASSISRLPIARAYFFAHYSFFPVSLKANPFLYKKKTLLFYSHPKDIGIFQNEFNYVFKKATRLICMNSFSSEKLVKDGLPKKKVTYEICGADPHVFQPHKRKGGAVGFSMAYYDRKNPERIINIIEKMPHCNFILVGKNWDKFKGFKHLIGLSNLIYVDNPRYSDYPFWYKKMDVFVSAATLEGGPIPLIEAMMCNIVPVASKTGFSQDIIIHGKNGFLFEIDACDEAVIELVEKAFTFVGDIRQSVKHLTWERYSKAVQGFLK